MAPGHGRTGAPAAGTASLAVWQTNGQLSTRHVHTVLGHFSSTDVVAVMLVHMVALVSSRTDILYTTPRWTLGGGDVGPCLNMKQVLPSGHVVVLCRPHWCIQQHMVVLVSSVPSVCTVHGGVLIC